MIRENLAVVTAAVALSASCALADTFTDTFDTIHSDWVTDRYEPAAFEVAADPVDGSNNVLRLAISNEVRPGGYSDMFYNTHGRKRAAEVGPVWTITGDLYVSAEMLSTEGALIRTDLWGRDSASVEAEALYPILGITNASPIDGFNPNAEDRSARLRYWDGTTGAWVDLATPLTTGWQTLGISYDGDSFNYVYNGVQIASVPVTTAPPASDLQTVMVQAYAFGGDNEDYAVFWDNISVTDVAVPEPAALSLVGLGALGLLRRKRR